MEKVVIVLVLPHYLLLGPEEGYRSWQSISLWMVSPPCLTLGTLAKRSLPWPLFLSFEHKTVPSPNFNPNISIHEL